MKGENIDVIADPWQLLAVRRKFQSGNFFDFTARGMISGQPFRIEQGQAAGLYHRNGLGDAEYALLVVAGIDLQRHGAGIGNIPRCRYGFLRRNIAGFAEMTGHRRGIGGKGEGQNQAQYANQTHVHEFL